MPRGYDEDTFTAILLLLEKRVAVRAQPETVVVMVMME